ncbi:diaminopimelate epimerase [Kushneria phosphatilytica]|uniref:Diaminopimelate epimerase n=1 Tax=Kushneria phosphatilytica TaxID=657387 RepID=A0A1S1NSA1_9GAMM|nr:diaminopimelate epimerase [Kushneria phosphatilytica]OHV08376.1 diaminopimelate epimerase [Kushneria phosphatilytica]QEL09799.1 diaminopimelate epimerase [Kushneria phosphatilytica]
MMLRFTKMHGLGNDFMVIDLITQRARLTPELIQRWADRRFGIGFDQLLTVEPPRGPEMDFRYRIYNADGGEVENCGNGARCFARFVVDQQLTRKREIRVETAAGPLTLTLADDGRVRVDMGQPRFEPERIPLKATQVATAYEFELNGQPITLDALSMGNPHAVIDVENVDTAPVATMGPAIEAHPRFPHRVNVGFLEVTDRHRARLRVFERGVGETLACGTGACAAVVSGIRRGLLDTPVDITLPGGALTIEWAGEHNGAPAAVIMTGPAERVFEGRIEL